MGNYTSQFIDTPDLGDLVIAMNSHTGFWIGHSLLIIFFVILILSMGTRSWNNFAVACYLTFIVSIPLYLLEMVPIFDILTIFTIAAVVTMIGFVKKN